MEPIRREALVEATIKEIGAQGTLDVTVSQIARRAGMSSGLAHHYFGSKEQIFLAAMRHVLSLYGAQVRVALMLAKTPQSRLEAIIRAGFEPGNFRRDVISAWLNFYVLAQTSDDAARLLTVYQKRLHSNLVHEFKALGAQDPAKDAGIIAALIDGIYIRAALERSSSPRQNPSDQVLDVLRHLLKRT
jgi:TetR/AcrR family transcriptional repressor of bet genes